MRDAFATPLLDAALRGAVVLLAALVLSVLLQRRSAALRHASWAGAGLFAAWAVVWLMRRIGLVRRAGATEIDR